MDFRRHSVTSNLIRFILRNATTGLPLTGLTNASAGLIISTICDNEAAPAVYTVAASNVETIATLGTFAAPTASKCRFREVSATNHPGLYEFQFLDARFSVASSRQLVISVSGAASLLTEHYIVTLKGYNPFDAVRLGLTALPNANAEAAGGLYTRGTGTGQINQPANGRIDVNAIAVSGTTQTARDLGASVLLSPGTGTGQITLSSGGVTLANGAHGGAGATVTLQTPITANVSDKTGFALSASGVTAVQTGLATPTNITAGTITTVTNLTNAPTAGDLTATMKTSITTAVWSSATRTLTSFGSLVADTVTAILASIWNTGAGLLLRGWVEGVPPGQYAPGPSDVVICNNALLMLGNSTINGFDDGTKAASLCAHFYQQAVDSVLSSYTWNPAMARSAALSESATAPAFGYSNRYDLPGDCLRVVSMSDDTPFRIEGKTLLCNESEAKILYIKRIAAADMGMQLSEVVSLKLSAMLSFPLTNSVSVADAMFKLYKDRQLDAQTNDAFEGTAPQMASDDWIKTRY